MLAKIKSRLTYATVMATAAVFIALGGGAYALERNSVGTAQLKDGAVKTKKIADNAVKTRKIAGRAVTAAKLATGEPYHEVGAAGEPAFENGWVNLGGGASTAAFYKDPLGVVHLKGNIFRNPGAVVAFTLPPGYRPSQTLFMPAGAISGAARLLIEPDGDVTPECVVDGPCDLGMDGLTFRVP